MRDLRTVKNLSEWELRKVECWRGSVFTWKRWTRPREEWTHDHCDFCSACICDHRDRNPHDKRGLLEGGYYRHAFYAERPNGGYVWVCRNCFKKLQPLVGWIRGPGELAKRTLP
jgi:hypothetical protein